MQIIFEDTNLQELIESGKNHKYRKYAKDKKFMKNLHRAYNALCSAENTLDLFCYSYLHYEKLKYRPESSIRVHNDYIERILFLEFNGGIIIKILKLDDTHYADR